MLGLPEVTPDQALAVTQQFSGSGSPALFLSSALVVFARIAGFFMFVPFFGSQNIPMTARVGFALVLSAIVSPLVMDTIAPGLAEAGGLNLILLLLNQGLIGLMLGLSVAFVFYAIESAGRIIDTQRGSNMSDIVAPMTGDRTSPTGQWLMMLALVILLTTGQHLMLIDGLVQSFQAVPATMSLDWLGHVENGKLPEGTVMHRFAQLSGEMLVIVIKIAAPAMLSLLLADILLGIINRGAPQVNVFALSQVIKGPLGIGALLISIWAISSYIGDGAIADLFASQRFDGGDVDGVSFFGLIELMDKNT